MRVFVLFETVFWVIIRVQQTSTLLPGSSVLLAARKLSVEQWRLHTLNECHIGDVVKATLQTSQEIAAIANVPLMLVCWLTLRSF